MQPYNHIEVLSFSSGPLETNAYLVICKETAHAAVIDAPLDSAAKIVTTAADIHVMIEKIIITHSHWDHIADSATMKEKTGAKIYIHRDDAYNLLKPGSDRLPQWILLESVAPDVFLEDGVHIAIGRTQWKVIHTPGHSPGSICLYCEEERILFSGDTIFRGTIGNISFPTSEPEKMWDSLKKLERLPKQTTVFPGHGDKTTLGAERWLPRAKELWG